MLVLCGEANEAYHLMEQDGVCQRATEDQCARFHSIRGSTTTGEEEQKRQEGRGGKIPKKELQTATSLEGKPHYAGAVWRS